ncbi:MAG: hypothetical protein ACO3CG_04590, partial [Ilumatobacteraceae bacterium]
MSHRARRLIVNLAQVAVLFGLAACSEDAADHTVNQDQAAVKENTVLEATVLENTVLEATVLEVIDG